MSESHDRKGKPKSGGSSGKGGRKPSQPKGQGQRGGSSGRGSGRGKSSGKSSSRSSQRGGSRYERSRDTPREKRDARGQGAEGDQTPAKLPAAAQGLPRHVVESLMRVTPASRQNAALVALAAAAEAFSDGQYHAAVKKAEHAKDLASRDATIREILGLAAYQVADWQKALRELRTYRRLSGETTHMPIEMDVLRALNRPDDVTAVWLDFKKRGGGPAVKKEARVVYASHLIDQGDLEAADEVAGSPRMLDDPWPEDLRLWYVSARIAGLRGDKRRARRWADAVVVADPSFPGLDDLDRLIENS